MNFCKLNQVVTLVATAIPGAVSLLEQINTSPDTRYAVTSLKKKCFSLFLCSKSPQKPFALDCDSQLSLPSLQE